MRLSGNNKTRGLLFVVAALVTGLLAVIIVVSIGSKMAPSIAALEAVQDIKAGTPLDRSMFKEVKLAEANVPTQLVDVSIDFTGLVAAKDISMGDIFREPAILSLKEGNPALFSARLKALGNPELRAVEIPTESAEGLITGMGPEDKVDLIAVYQELQTIDGFAVAEDTLTAKTIIRAAPVIGVKPGDTENVEGAPSTLLIVALTEKQIETVSLYRELGSVYASLRPFGDQEDVTKTEELEEKEEIEELEEKGVEDTIKDSETEIEKIGDVEDIELEDLDTPVSADPVDDSTEQEVEEDEE